MGLGSFFSAPISAKSAEAPDRTIPLMRIGFITSVVGHMALLLGALISPTRMQTAQGDTIAVELVSPAEFARAAKNEQAATPPAPAPSQPPSPPEPKPAAAPSDAKPAPAPAQTASAPASSSSAPPVAPQPQPAPPAVSEMPADPNRLAALLHLPLDGASEGYGSEAESSAKLSPAEIAAFKAHLRTCWTLPPGIAETQKVRVIVRVALKPDGALAGPPMLIEASASALGPPLVQSAMRALKSCAPYTMLPTAKYREWKVLDLNFSPDAMTGG